jgi:hypothetical protein
MEATLAEEELGPAEALGEPERTRMAGVNFKLQLDQYNLLSSVTHLCPRGPVATGLGPDWSEERDVARAAGLERAECAYIWRVGSILAAGQECVVGASESSYV